jgi:hypothetical protein
MQEQERISIYKDFLKYCYGELNIKQSPRIKITRDKNFVKFNFSFGGYYPQEKAIVVYDNNRNLADCLRTLAHELIHAKQFIRGEINQQNLIWRGQRGPYDCRRLAYRKTPWEKEAYSQEKELKKIYWDKQYKQLIK